MQYTFPSESVDNQIHKIEAGAEVEAIILELVGDLAAYRPGAKVVFFEGEDSDFDLKMVSRIFPEIEKKMNFVSGGNKFRVKQLHSTLERSVLAGGIPVKVYSIVDKDSDPDICSADFHRHFSWDVYHIENYLLEPEFIFEALKHIGIYCNDIDTVDKIGNELKNIARDQINELVAHKLREEIGGKLVRSLSLNTNNKNEDVGSELHRAITKSLEKAKTKVEDMFGISTLRENVTKEKTLLETSLATDDWRKYFKGRNILKAFAGKYAQGLRYEYFRDLIISVMVNAGFKPNGMKIVISRILED